MRFRLFGGADCPDALLAQLSVLAPLGDDAARSIIEFVVESLSRTERPGEASAQESRDQLVAEVGLPAMDVAQAACAVDELLRSMLRHDVPEDTAAHELSMLGLHKSLVDALIQGRNSRSTDLGRAATLRLPKMPGVAHVATTQPSLSAEGGVSVHATLHFDDGVTPPAAFDMPVDKARALLAELVEARESLRA